MIKYQDIIQFGLDEKEARVFLASLELGGENVLSIAKKAGINRVATYEAIESLVKKGLLSSLIKGKRTYYTATDPERLSYLFEQEKNAINNKEQIFEKLLPELKSIYNFTENKPKVTYYEGREGIKTIQYSFLKTKDKILRLIYFYDIIEKVFTKNEMDEYGKKRVAANIRVKCIAVVKDKKQNFSTPTKNVDRVYLDYKDFPMESDITIFDNKIAMVSLGQMFGVVIENAELASTMKSFFDLTLSIAQKNPKNL